MRILFTRFPLESAWGGAEIQTHSLIEGLRSRGHEVSFLGSCPVLLNKLGEADVEVTELQIGPPPVTKWGVISFVWRQFGMKRMLLDALSGMEVDVVCMLSLSEKILLTPFLLTKNVKVLWIEHDLIGRWLTSNPWLPRLRRLSQHVTTIGVSDLSAKIIVADLGYPEERVRGIANGVSDQRLVGSGRRPEKLSAISYQLSAPLRVGCIARLTPDKGVDVLINSCQRLAVSCQLVGSGRGEERIRSLLSSLDNARDDIELLPSVPNIGDFYRSLDLFVLPSRDHDPFGLVAAEAMLCRVPVIVTDACGIADYCTHGEDALIVEAGSVEALSNAIEKMRDPELRNQIAEKGYCLASKLFTIDRMVDDYEHCMMKG